MSVEAKCPKCGAAYDDEMGEYRCGSYWGMRSGKRTKFYYGVQCLERQLSATTSRAEAAEAIVAKLPKTADGVAVTLEMEVYDVWTDAYVTLMPHGCVVDWSQIYSTREAAKSAKEAK